MSDMYAAALARVSQVPGVRGALIVEAEAGVPVLAELAEDVNGTAVAALAAALFQRSAQASRAAHFGGLGTLQLEAEAGHVVVVYGGELLIVAVAERGAQLGMVRLEAHRAAESLQ
jgi:predicted regulator of Ras-like GTPase activity (Roadblock/LC7/MglB family)